MPVTSGQFATPRNGGYGAIPGSGLVVRGSPCRPVCMLAMATTANAVRTAAAMPPPNRTAPDGVVSLVSGIRLVNGSNLSFAPQANSHDHRGQDPRHEKGS